MFTNYFHSLTFLLPILPLTIIIVTVWLISFIVLFWTLLHVVSNYAKLAETVEKKARENKSDKHRLISNVQGLYQELDRRTRMMYFDLEKLKNHVGIPQAMDNIVNVSQEVAHDVIDKFSTQPSKETPQEVS